MSPHLTKMCQCSSFAARLVREAAELAIPPTALSKEQRIAQITTWARMIFQGWGQTKVITTWTRRSASFEDKMLSLLQMTKENRRPPLVFWATAWATTLQT